MNILIKLNKMNCINKLLNMKSQGKLKRKFKK